MNQISYRAALGDLRNRIRRQTLIEVASLRWSTKETQHVAVVIAMNWPVISPGVPKSLPTPADWANFLAGWIRAEQVREELHDIEKWQAVDWDEIGRYFFRQAVIASDCEDEIELPPLPPPVWPDDDAKPE